MCNLHIFFFNKKDYNNVRLLKKSGGNKNGYIKARSC